MDNNIRHRLGDTIHPSELGLRGQEIRVWDACKTCGIERWVRLSHKGRNCKPCAQILHPNPKSTNHASTMWVSGTEPKVGDATPGKTIGRGNGHYLWTVCPECGKGRWVSRRQHALNTLCVSCANTKRLLGKTNPRWNNGVRYDPSHGFYVRVNPDHPFYRMSMHAGGQRYIAEHRLVMAMHIGRPLEKWEIVHHINGINTDNRLENLELLPKQSNHLPYNMLQNQVRELQSRVTILEGENTLLKFQLEGMSIPSQAEENNDSSGVCRDLTGDTLQSEGEEKVRPFGKPEDKDA